MVRQFHLHGRLEVAVIRLNVQTALSMKNDTNVPLHGARKNM